MKSTRDYSQFRHISGNRDVNAHHVEGLVEAIERRNLLQYFPVLVNEDMEVIDGQHRLAAAASLDVDIYYQVVKGLRIEDVMQINTANRKWSLADFIDSYIEMGNPEYIKLNKFAKDHNISASVAAALLMGNIENRHTAGAGGSRAIKSGDFHIVVQSHADKVVKLLNDILPFCEFEARRSRDFIATLSRLLKNEDFEPDHLIAKLRLHGLRISPRVNLRYYILQFEEIYNFKSKAKVELYKSSFSREPKNLPSAAAKNGRY